MRSRLVFLVIVSIFFQACQESEPIKEKLWYQSPAKDWFSALPLGNGRLGAMVFGTIEQEHIQLNEESLWAGCPENPYPDDVDIHYQKFRELNLNRQYSDALNYAMDHLAVRPTSFRSYQPLGDLFIKLGHQNPNGYKRELDLETGINMVRYEMDGTQYIRESFISVKYDAMFFHFKAIGNDNMQASIQFERERDIQKYINGHGVLCIDGQIIDDPNGYDDNRGGSGKGGKHLKIASRIAVKTETGAVEGNKDVLEIQGAESFTVIVSAATDYNPELLNFDRDIDVAKKVEGILRGALNTPYDLIRQEHMEYHARIYKSLDFNISDLTIDSIPTDRRLTNLIENQGTSDNYLTQVFFQYGRYLLMNSSGGMAVLPANLQGLWNKDMWAAWEADYHLNINLQMNYWPADVCNLSQTFDPLSNYMLKLSERGKITANKFIGSDGWMTHHCSNVFGRTTPSGSNEASQVNNGYCFPLAGAWMSLSLWRHFEFTQDLQYLEYEAYPVLKGAAKFVLDFLVENEKGELVTVPSYSPENAYFDPETGQSIRNTVAATMDIQIIKELFQACINAEELLGLSELTGRIEEATKKLPKVKIGADGTIQEWYEDYEEVNPGHRHVSHLFGLHPGSQITPSTSEMFLAAQNTIEKRLSSGGGQTGWSRAWMINFYARLMNGNECNRHINALLKTLVSPNLFDLHPPYTFQIDGNLGATAGVAEMLIQSHEENIIRLLPALPDVWKNGYIHGVKARGAYLIDMNWKEGVLQKVRIKAEKGGTPKIIYGDKVIELELSQGQESVIDFANV